MKHNIAIVGCGAIVNVATLPCYRKHGLDVVGCYDIKREAAECTARAWAIPRVYDTFDDLLGDTSISIVEIAIPPDPQVTIDVIESGKHVLCQKPLAVDLLTAQRIVKTARVNGVKLAVNQQLRWGPSVRAAHGYMQQGYVGKVQSATFYISVHTDWSQWAWLPSQPRLEVLFHSIHYLDTLRFWFGEPEWVTSRHMHTDPAVAGESRTLTILDYANGMQALIDDEHHNTYGEPLAEFTIVGDKGELRGTLGSMLEYPNACDDTIEYIGHMGLFRRTLVGTWIPDAFIGPITSLIHAIENDSEPETSGTDNLKTLALVNACYLSHNGKHAVHV